MQTSLQTDDSAEVKNLVQAILAKKATIGVIGLGYVGLPLVRALNGSGYKCIGFDTDIRKIESLRSGKSYIKSLTDEHVKELNDSQNFIPTSNVHDIAKMDAVLICVPTPLTKNREPDMRYVIAAAETIGSQLRQNQLIVLESTTYPGTTCELLKPILERNGMKVGDDFYLAYSPEREDPGNCSFETSTIPKVVGADDENSKQLALALYREITPKVVEVSTSATAEAVKLTENIFRFVNIALANELKCIYAKMGIDIWEVVDAAKTKPFGYMPFYPGPGLGGHCIPIDPFYLTWKAREFGVATQLVELSGQINGQMASYVVEQLRKELDLRFEKGLRNTRILLVGVAYKKNIDDLRESPALIIFERLLKYQAKVDYFDSLIPEIAADSEHPLLVGRKSINLTKENLHQYDAVLICTDHDGVDYNFIVDNSKIVIDTRNAVKATNLEKNNVVKA